MTRPGVPRKLDAVIARGMAKDPDARYLTAGDLGSAAQAALGHAPVSPSPSRAETAISTPQFGQPTVVPVARARADASVASPVQGPWWPRRGPLLALASVAIVIAVLVSVVIIYFAPDTSFGFALPLDFGSANCRSEPVQGADLDAVTVVTCGSGPANGPTAAEFRLYKNSSDLTSAFASYASANNLGGGDASRCRTGSNEVGTWVEGGSVRGQFACQSGSGYVVMVWTDPQTLSLSRISRTDGNAALLYDWWSRRTPIGL